MYDSIRQIRFPSLTLYQANNPSGGLGLTTGIIDAFCHGNALARVINDEEPDELLTECASSRREAWINFTSPISRNNFKRDSDTQDPEGMKFSKIFFSGLKHDPNFATKVKKMHNGILERSFARPANPGHAEKQVNVINATTHERLSRDLSNTHTGNRSDLIPLLSQSKHLDKATYNEAFGHDLLKPDNIHIEDVSHPVAPSG